MPFCHKVRVRYAETDAQGVVHHSQYFVYFEAARVEYMRAACWDYRTAEENGIAAPLVEAYCRYLAPARFDDELTVETHIAEMKSSTTVWTYRISRNSDGKAIAEGKTVHACVNLATGRPVRLPADLKEGLLSFEREICRDDVTEECPPDPQSKGIPSPALDS